ncbi:GPP34 family phosphoprotein [Streptomyces sp. TRM66268-LWL]|uniref:GPP34 family phosphoprotein n=1 Tax=Streptomyces polyasparticus TaxID=2767826 RepID=A0ABR7SQ66_9ACTN|nr:GPP34 family phosphoprotein [Streptomyces polyasparticus]MBC9716727.1 GPP34 family phosphoprotein [Streptomyces polyasparticus]
MTITLAEEIMLLSLDDESGSAKKRDAAGWAVAGALLLELVLAGRVAVRGKHVAVVDAKPTGEPLLDDRVELLRKWIGERGERRVNEWLGKEQGRAVAPVVARLCARGVVVEEKRKALGIFPVRRYPEADGTVERELRDRLNAVVLRDAEPDVRTAGLIALVHGARLHEVAFPGERRGDIAPRMEQVAAGEWAGESVRAAIRDMQALMAAVTAATVVTVAAAG